MRVFSEINCQQKQNKKQKQKTDKTKRGAPLLGLANLYINRNKKKKKNGFISGFPPGGSSSAIIWG